MNKKHLKTILLLGCFGLLPLQTLQAQSTPTTLVAKESAGTEYCYDLNQISKISFQGGAMELKHKDDTKSFTPESLPLASISMLYFAKDKQPNNSKPVAEPESELSYRFEGEQLIIEGLQSSDETLFVYGTDGSLIAREPVSGNSLTLDASLWAKGVYLVTTNLSKNLKVIR